MGTLWAHMDTIWCIGLTTYSQLHCRKSYALYSYEYSYPEYCNVHTAMHFEVSTVYHAQLLHPLSEHGPTWAIAWCPVRSIDNTVLVGFASDDNALRILLDC